MDNSVFAITSFFNPAGSSSRWRSYGTFRRALSVPLITVELSFDGHFQLDAADADILIQLHACDVLWHKERLLNIAISRVPESCENVAWLDADVILTNPDWPHLANDLLRRHRLVQLFGSVKDVLPNGQPAAVLRSERRSFAYMLEHNAITSDVFATRQRGRHLGYSIGFAWAARRTLLSALLLYDAMILGGGDEVFVAAATGSAGFMVGDFDMGPRHAEHYLTWAQRCYSVIEGSIGYVPGELLHQWHGTLETRRYGTRYDGFSKHNFDPGADLSCNDEGVWRWNTDKLELHRYVESYIAQHEQ